MDCREDDTQSQPLGHSEILHLKKVYSTPSSHEFGFIDTTSRFEVSICFYFGL